MGFTKLIKSVLNISALPDRVENQASTLKATFDQAGVDIKEAHNALIGELEASTAASNLGATNPSGETSTVQAELDKFNGSIDGKVDKAEGKQLSTEDFTTEEKAKLAGIAEGANNYVLPVASTTELGGVKVDGTTIVVENGVVKAKAADAADYTARTSVEKLSNNVLKKNNTEEYTPTDDFNPATKKYVDDAMSNIQVDDNLNDTSVNPVQNKVINEALAKKADSANLPVISSSTIDLSAGTSALPTGNIYLVYE